MTAIATDIVVGVDEFLSEELANQIAALFHRDYCETSKEDEAHE